MSKRWKRRYGEFAVEVDNVRDQLPIEIQKALRR
jgi:hypothetical protein